MSYFPTSSRMPKSACWSRRAVLLIISFFLAGGFCLAQSAGGEKKADPSQTEEIEPKPNRKAKLNDITFDSLKFDIEPDAKFDTNLLTKEINDLNGQKVRLRGYIRPSVKQKGITNFVFVRDNQECCFGPGAAIYDCVLVSLDKDKSTEYTVRPVSVVGEFYLKEFIGPNGNTWAIFRMRNAIVE
jgi:hypothetical protein